MEILPQIFSSSRQTDISPLVFQGKQFVVNPGKLLWVNIIGPSGAGKDTIKDILLRTGKFHYVRTATSRNPRKGESDKDYLWMRQQKTGEPTNSYIRSAIRQYNLLEHNFHYGNLYGTPYESVKRAIISRKIPLYCAENNGARFMEKALESLCNVLTIMIVPDSLEEMEKRILSGDRDNPTKRLQESREKIIRAPQDAHFIVKNPSKTVEKGKSGLESAVGAVKRLIAKFAT